MEKRLFVHVGANKTGSSAIQQFLARNHAELRRSGIAIPDQNLAMGPDVTGFQVFAFERLFQCTDGKHQLEVAVDNMFSSSADVNAAVLSAENLISNPVAPTLFAGLVKKFDVRVILYVRRQDEYLLSYWQQWDSKVSNDFWAWLVRESGSLGDWRAYLMAWEAVVPRSNIIVRVFEKPRLDSGNVVVDFYNRLGLDRPFDEFAAADVRVNPSFSDAVVDLVKGNQLVFSDAHDNDFYDFVLALTGERYIKNSRQSVITFDQRVAILSKYSASNRWVRESFFQGSHQPLFSMPQKNDYDYISQDEMLGQKMEFLTTMLYMMHKKQK